MTMTDSEAVEYLERAAAAGDDKLREAVRVVVAQRADLDKGLRDAQNAIEGYRQELDWWNKTTLEYAAAARPDLLAKMKAVLGV